MPNTKEELVIRLFKMWDQIKAWKEQPGGLDAVGAIETPTANPVGKAPWFAINQTNTFLQKQEEEKKLQEIKREELIVSLEELELMSAEDDKRGNEVTENEKLITEYQNSDGLEFIREGMVSHFRDELGCRNLDAGERNISKENILMLPGINAGLALLYTQLTRTPPEQTKKRVAVLTTSFFYSIPNPEEVSFHRMPTDLIKGDKVTPEILEAEIEKLRQDGYDSIVFYNVNPDNPSGHVMDAMQTQQISQFFSEKKYNNVIVVNDFAYNGTQFDSSVPRASAICGEGINSLTFSGISKLGSPGYRSAAVAGNKQLISDLSNRAFETYICPSTPAQLTQYFFFHEDNRAERERYLAEKAEIYKFNSQFFKTLIDGGLDALPNSIQKKMVRTMREAGINSTEATQMLRDGVKGVTVLNDPKAAFFTILDFSELRGKPYVEPMFDDTTQETQEPKIIRNGMDVAETIFATSKMFMLPLDLMAMGNNYVRETDNPSFAMRFSHAQDPLQIAKTCIKLRETLKTLLPEQEVSSTRVNAMSNLPQSTIAMS